MNTLFECAYTESVTGPLIVPNVRAHTTHVQCSMRPYLGLLRLGGLLTKTEDKDDGQKDDQKEEAAT